MKILKLGLMTALAAISLSASAGNQWYYGKVTQIVTLGADGSFMVYVNNSQLKSNCLYDRVNFLASTMGAERTKLAFSMALAAQASDSQWGVVVDLPTQESTCSVSPSSTQGAAIR